MKDMNTAKKEKAIQLLKEMDIYKPYIKGFEEKGTVCFFENYGGFWIDQEPELYAKMKEIEKKYNCLVYAVTHEFTPFGECYSFLIVTDYRSEWKTLMYATIFSARKIETIKDSFTVFPQFIFCNIAIFHSIYIFLFSGKNTFKIFKYFIF